MSLRMFHMVFISLSVLLFSVCGVWALLNYVNDGEGGMLLGGVASFLMGIGLALYGVRVWKKLKTLNQFAAPIVLNTLLLCTPIMVDRALACPTCYGDPTSTTAEGINAAILFLLAVTGSVFGGIGAFIYHIRRNAALARISDDEFSKN